MTSKAIEEAFQRHPRPQVPTKAALLLKSRQNDKPAAIPAPEAYKNLWNGLVQRSPWKTLTRQGDLVQGKHVWSISIHEKQLVMVKETTLEAGRQVLEKVSKLSDHPHIATIKQAFEVEKSMYFQLEYCRYTLEEVLNVHTRLEEVHIRVIASSIFLAIKHLANTGIVHNGISTSAIRFCGTGRPLLSSFEDCHWVTTEHTPNKDLECLGVVTLECMNGSPNETLRDPMKVRRLRKSNKIFGLENGEKWSGFKLLVDFLDNMFNESVPAIAKLDKPHRYVDPKPGFGILIPFLELVPLECFALWRAAKNES